MAGQSYWLCAPHSTPPIQARMWLGTVGGGVDKFGPKVQMFPKEVAHEGVVSREGGGRIEQKRAWQEIKRRPRL